MANGTAAVTAKERTPAQRMKQFLDTRTEEFGAALAGRVDPDAFIRVAYATITKSPKLLEATTSSVMMALLECASLGLVPNSVMGEAYLVPFNNKVKGQNGQERWEVQAQFIPGYRGLIKLARQSGVVRTIVPRIVRAGDTFDLEYGLDEKLIHIPDLRSISDEAPMTFVYAVAHLTDGMKQFEVMSRSQVDAVRARSKSKDSGPWVTDYDAMSMKSPIRRLFKYIPSSDFDLTRALEADNRDYEDVSRFAGLGGAAAAPALTRTERVRARIAGPIRIDDYDEAQFDEQRESPQEEEKQKPQRQKPKAEKKGEPAPEQKQESDEPSQLVVFGTEAFNMEPSGTGNPATKQQRDRIREITLALKAHLAEDERDRLGFLAAAPGLSRGQAGKLIGLGKLAADALGITLPSQEAAQENESEDEDDVGDLV